MTASLSIMGPEECPLDKVPAQIEQRNTECYLGPRSPAGFSVQTCWDEGPRLAFSPSLQSQMCCETSPCIRAEMHIWDTT